MAGISRREFLEKSAVGAGAAGFLAANAGTLGANPLGLPIGSQTYPHRALIAEGKFAECSSSSRASASIRSSSAASSAARSIRNTRS